MIFSELYSVYYNTVAKILSAALKENVTEKELSEIVSENAFSESTLTVLPSLKSEKWQLLHSDLSPAVKHIPTMPLTFLQKRWLKSVSLDKRIRLFDVKLPDLSDVEPLFTDEDYKIYDKYSDGDSFESENYIKNFRTVYRAIKEKTSVQICMVNRFGKKIRLRFRPVGLEYSEKDDKFRVLAADCRYSHFNLGRIESCEPCENRRHPEALREEHKKELVFELTDSNNALERAMLHFAHFEKQAERINESKYLVKLKYSSSDEAEMVIRILSFGTYIKVIEPQSLVNSIKDKLICQKNCELL